MYLLLPFFVSFSCLAYIGWKQPSGGGGLWVSVACAADMEIIKFGAQQKGFEGS